MHARACVPGGLATRSLPTVMTEHMCSEEGEAGQACAPMALV